MYIVCWGGGGHVHVGYNDYKTRILLILGSINDTIVF